MKKIIVVAIMCFAFVSSCKKLEKTKLSDNISENENIMTLDTLQLKLNDGNKWIANAETHEGVLQMQAIISEFKKDNKKDCNKLGNSLTKQTNYIIKHCNMKGESHDQLHVVLVPMLNEISVLKEENNIQKTKFVLQNLEQLISAYFKFFDK